MFVDKINARLLLLLRGDDAQKIEYFCVSQVFFMHKPYCVRKMSKNCVAILSNKRENDQKKNQTHVCIKERVCPKTVAVKHLFSHVSSLQLVRFYSFSLKHARVCACVCACVDLKM